MYPMPRMLRPFALPWLMLCICLLGARATAQDPRSRPKPNVLVITVDTFRPDHLGAYGYGRPTSPHLDSIAADGVVFRQAYSTSAWTAPGLISLLTSLDAPSHGVDVRGKSIRPGVVTLADALRAGGYRAPDIFFLTDIPNFHHLGFESYSKRSQYIRDGDEILFRWLQEEASSSQEPTAICISPTIRARRMSRCICVRPSARHTTRCRGPGDFWRGRRWTW